MEKRAEMKFLKHILRFFQNVLVFVGHPSWGIAWYLNDLLIPEVYVERGQTYTFLIEGGNDETQPARLT